MTKMNKIWIVKNNEIRAFYVIQVDAVTQYDNRSNIFRKDRVGGSIVINNYWKTGNWKLIYNTNTLSRLTIYIYITYI